MARKGNDIRREKPFEMEELQNALNQRLRLLSTIEITFGSAFSQNAQAWVKNLESVQKMYKRPRTIIGVVGATGVGKSSLVNALFNEESILPTSGDAACTAVITEVSWNFGDRPYGAEIDFMKGEEWRTELEIALDDIADSGKALPSGSEDENSDAGVAIAKIKAVYPDLVGSDPSAVSIEELMNHANVSMLGQIHTVECDDAVTFREALQGYVNSKASADFQYWPLIRSVRIYIKADILANGLVVVDLPGNQDSNAARNAVAQQYLQNCSRIIVTAPIKRAVNDKTAKTLLGQSFKQQLTLDGNVNNVVFVCTISDDILITESLKYPDLNAGVSTLDGQLKDLEKEKNDLRLQYQGLNDALVLPEAALSDLDEERDLYEAFHEQLRQGKTVYKPEPRTPGSGRKRKRGKRVESNRKHHAGTTEYVRFDIEDESTSDEETPDLQIVSTPERAGPRFTLSEDDIVSRLQELRRARIQAKERCHEITQQKKQIRQQTRSIESKLDELRSTIRNMCILSRNQRVRSQIQHDFAAGVKEYDQELAMERDPDSFDPSDNFRDYDRLAARLPVFCVSARAYQQLRGAYQQESPILGFKDVQDTEIPALAQYCRVVADDRLQTAIVSFMDQSDQMLGSLHLWADSKAHTIHNRLGQGDGAIKSEILQRLCTSLRGQCDVLNEIITSHLVENIYATFQPAVEKATEKASQTSSQWGAPPGKGGLYYQTYRAVVKRDGFWTNKLNFNGDLTRPIIAQISAGWKQFFEESLSSCIKAALRKFESTLSEFRAASSEILSAQGAGPVILQQLDQQFQYHKKSLQTALNELRESVINSSKQAHRQFAQVVTNEMHNVYRDCLEEKGPGAYQRMKALMNGHIENSKNDMFDKSTKIVSGLLDGAVQVNGARFKASVEELYSVIEKNYSTVSANTTHASSEEEKDLKREILKMITDAGSDAVKQTPRNNNSRKEQDAGVDRVSHGISTVSVNQDCTVAASSPPGGDNDENDDDDDDDDDENAQDIPYVSQTSTIG